MRFIQSLKLTLILIGLFLPIISEPGQQNLHSQTYRGWYQFHALLNRMPDLQPHDKVNIIFALQEVLEKKLPIDYLWKSEEVDGLRSLILTGFTFEMPPAKIATACATLFDAYQLGAVHPEIIEFFELLLVENLSAEKLKILSQVSQGLKIFPEAIRVQFISEIYQSNWEPYKIGAAARCLKKAQKNKLDLNKTLIGTIITVSQGVTPATIDVQLDEMLQILQHEKTQAQKLTRYTAIAGKYRNTYLSNSFINNLTIEAVESGWREKVFQALLSTIVKGAKNGLPHEKLAMAIIIRISQEDQSLDENINQYCQEEYQFFYRLKTAAKKRLANRNAGNFPQQRFKASLPAGAPVSVSSEGILQVVNSYIGTPYRYGGSSMRGIDCSALTQNVYGQCGVRIPRTSKLQYNWGQQIRKSEMALGDLVFFATNFFRYVNHVGIYLGDNRFCHASSSRGVVIDNINKYYYQNRFVGARRIW